MLGKEFHAVLRAGVSEEEIHPTSERLLDLAV
jgi:hypothetical protein